MTSHHKLAGMYTNSVQFLLKMSQKFPGSATSPFKIPFPSGRDVCFPQISPSQPSVGSWHSITVFHLSDADDFMYSFLECWSSGCEPQMLGGPSIHRFITVLLHFLAFFCDFSAMTHCWLGFRIDTQSDLPSAISSDFAMQSVLTRNYGWQKPQEICTIYCCLTQQFFEGEAESNCVRLWQIFKA